MDALESLIDIEEAKSHLEGIVKPFQQEINRQQKKADFIKNCIRSLEKNDFFRLDELLKDKLSNEVEEDSNLAECGSLFTQLKAYTDEQIEQYKSEFKNHLVEIAEQAGLPITVDLPRFSFLKGIEAEVNFGQRKTTLNQVTIKSLDPRRIVSAAVKCKRQLYDSPFDPQGFIDSLFACYQEILKQEKSQIGAAVPIYSLYTSYVWSLQTKAFLQNMDKAKFKGYSLEQFAVDFWRFFSSEISFAGKKYSIRLSAGRLKPIWLIDQMGEKRQISHASFVRSE